MVTTIPRQNNGNDNNSNFSFFLSLANSLGVLACKFLPSRSLLLALHKSPTVAVFPMDISVSQFVTTELVSPGGIGSDAGYAGCRWVKIPV